MACPIGKDEIAKLKMFVGFCSQNPSILNLPELGFFKSFIEQLGGNVPEAKPTEQPKPQAEPPKMPKAAPEPAKAEKEEDAESDLELDNDGVVEPDTEDPQEMGDADKEPTDDEIEQASELRGKAAAAYSEQNYQEAVQLYTEAIQLNPRNALFHAKRGQAYLKLVKPNACIRDCERALEINSDSAAAYKFRGRAYRLLGNWEQAAKDLRQACKLDYDEEADEWLREVTPNAKKIEAHKLKQERKRVEREERERKERVRAAQEANKKAREEAEANAAAGGGEDDEDFMGGMGGMSGAGGADFLNAFKDPEVAAAMQDILQNPANISKYMSNPKVMALLSKVGGAMGGGAGGMPFGFGGAPGGAGGFPGGFPGAGGAGGFPGFPGAPGGADAPPTAGPKPDLHDDGLD